MAHNNEMNLAWQYLVGTQTSVFLTGKAGTGKTTFLRKLREMSPKRMVVLAPTGVAAINADGQTIHSFFQLDFSPFLPGVRNEEYEKRFFRMSKEKKNIIRTMDLLVIDEISMVRSDLLDAVDDVMRRYRNPSQPFGGVQLLMIGDLQQLAPVAKDDEWQLLSEHYDTPYFFDSHALRQLQYVTIELKHIYRQQDEHFISILAAIRENRVTPDIAQQLNARYIPNFTPTNNPVLSGLATSGPVNSGASAATPTHVNGSTSAVNDDWIRLTTHNRMAQEYNDNQLAKLRTPPCTYKAKIEDNFPDYAYPTDVNLILKVGAQVMFVKNDSSKEKLYYNGKIGRVVEISPRGIYVKCKEDDDVIAVSKETWENKKYVLDDTTKEITETVDGTFTQYPLRLAWAITIHKSQGLTFSHAVLDVNQSFAHGQVYVALSRCRSLEGLVLSSPIDVSRIITDKKVDGFIDEAMASSVHSAERLPRQRYEYFYLLLQELFNFGKLSYGFEHLMRIAGNNFTNSQQTFIDVLHAAQPRIKPELTDVSERFKVQYDRLITAAGINFATDKHLQDRIHSATLYFGQKVKDIFSIVLDSAKIISKAIGNKAVKHQFDIAVDELQLSYDIKLGTLRAVYSEGFTPKVYISSKAKSSLIDAEKPKRHPRHRPNKTDFQEELDAIIRKHRK